MTNPRVDQILENVEVNRQKVGEHPYCTINFNKRSGTIYEYGYNSQREDHPNSVSVSLMYDMENLCPIGALVDPNSANRTGALRRMLDQVEDHRAKVSKEAMAEL